MALHLPKPRTKKPAQQAVGLDGLKVSVANAATSGVEKSKQVKTGGLAGLTSKVTVKQLRTELGNEGLRQAAIDAGRTPPSDRTLRRSAQQGRIPHADVLERAQRRAAIERLGGIDAVAAKIGRSRSAVSRYRSGETNELRADASKKLKTVRAEDIMARAGVLRPDGTPKTAVIRVKGGVMVRNGADEGYDYRVRTLDFANSDTPSRTDAADHALAALAESRINEVVVLGRRGPAQAAYTTPELLALGHLRGIDVSVDPTEAELDAHTTAWLRDHPDPTAQFKASITAEYATRIPRHRRR